MGSEAIEWSVPTFPKAKHPLHSHSDVWGISVAQICIRHRNNQKVISVSSKSQLKVIYKFRSTWSAHLWLKRISCLRGVSPPDYPFLHGGCVGSFPLLGIVIRVRGVLEWQMILCGSSISHLCFIFFFSYKIWVLLVMI